MNKKKTIIAAIVLLLVLLVGGAIAYFTDEDTKTNTFTLGNIKIALDEGNWNANDAKDLMPGAEVVKEPKVLNTGKNDAYVFIKVEEPCYEGAPLFQFGDANAVNDGWVPVVGDRTCSGNKATTVYAYSNGSTMTVVDKENGASPTLFDKVVLPSDLDEDDFAAIEDAGLTLDIVLTAYGIQTTGLEAETPTSVWTNFS